MSSVNLPNQLKKRIVYYFEPKTLIPWTRMDTHCDGIPSAFVKSLRHLYPAYLESVEVRRAADDCNPGSCPTPFYDQRDGSSISVSRAWKQQTHRSGSVAKASPKP